MSYNCAGQSSHGLFLNGSFCKPCVFVLCQHVDFTSFVYMGIGVYVTFLNPHVQFIVGYEII